MPRTDGLVIRSVVIGGETFEKPWDPTCPACRSPWLAQIDEMLAEGYTVAAIRAYLTGRHPAAPPAPYLTAHISHLAAPHRKMREQLQEAADRSGGTDGSSLVGVASATSAVIQRGFEQLAHGQLEITSRDLLRALQLQLQIDKEQQGAGVEASAWQAAFMSFFEIVRRHLTPASWRAFVTDVYASPEIRTVLAEAQAQLPGATGEL